MARRATVPEGEKGGIMIIQMIFWIVLAVLGCAAFAALGIWAAITDEGHTAQRRRAVEMQAISEPSQWSEEIQVLLARMGPP
jgi:flagellar basal body-associated protein FliL